MGQHNVKVDDHLWSAAMAKARAEGKALTDVIAAGLRDYIGAFSAAGIAVTPDLSMPPGAAALVSPGHPPVIIATAVSAAAEPVRRPSARPVIGYPKSRQLGGKK